MCRLVVRARDSFGPDSRKHHRGHRRGHVIEILEDGQHAGNLIENSPMWRIIEVPGVIGKTGDEKNPGRFERLLENEDATPGTDAQKKKHILDLDALEKSANAARGGRLSHFDKITILNPDTIDGLVTVSRRGERFAV